jgi:hypothetical protein
VRLPKPQEHQPRKIEIKPGSAQGNGAGGTVAAEQPAPEQATAEGGG